MVENELKEQKAGEMQDDIEEICSQLVTFTLSDKIEAVIP